MTRPAPHAHGPSLAARIEVARRYGATGPGTWPASCVYCGASGSIIWRAQSVSLDGLTLDHWTPRARGGTDTADNLVLACQACNRRKGAAAPETVIDVLPTAAEAERVRAFLATRRPGAAPAPTGSAPVTPRWLPDAPTQPERARCQVGKCRRWAVPGRRWCEEHQPGVARVGRATR
jgi:hypothetical protein